MKSKKQRDDPILYHFSKIYI